MKWIRFKYNLTSSDIWKMKYVRHNCEQVICFFYIYIYIYKYIHIYIYIYIYIYMCV